MPRTKSRSSEHDCYWNCSGCLVNPSPVFDPNYCTGEVPPTPQPDSGVPEWSSWPQICIDIEVPCCALLPLPQCLPCDSPCVSICHSDSESHSHCGEGSD